MAHLLPETAPSKSWVCRRRAPACPSEKCTEYRRCGPTVGVHARLSIPGRPSRSPRYQRHELQSACRCSRGRVRGIPRSRPPVLRTADVTFFFFFLLFAFFYASFAEASNGTQHGLPNTRSSLGFEASYDAGFRSLATVE
ncbi:hypothetical protein ISCGN_010569 [Ixodes scapularis]